MTKAHEQLREVHVSAFRPIKPPGTEPHMAFEVKLKGEMVQGEGGPYRAFFTDVSSEMQPSNISSH